MVTNDFQMLPPRWPGRLPAGGPGLHRLGAGSG